MVKKFQSNNYDPYRTHPSADGGASSSMSVTLYQPSETAPLLPGQKQRTRTCTPRCCRVGGWCLLLVFSLMLYQTCMHFIYCPLSADTRDAIRREWEKEKNQHSILQREWEFKHQEQVEKEENWRRATEWHEREVENLKREEQERQEKVRQEWARRIEHHEREFQELLSREKKERELERERWREEVEKRDWWEEEERRRQEKVQQEWARKIERHEHEFQELLSREKKEREQEWEKWRREVEERDQREEEERQRRHMFWGNVAAHTCTTYATREYTAQLMNLPTDWKHRIDACKATSLEIHGISYLPKTCEDKGPGVVIGRWEISQQEPDCTTFWSSYDDKGCTSPGSGKKYITHKLMNLPEKGDWREFCATTPARFNHMQFPGAQECFTATWGVYGQWEMDDSNC